MGSDIGEHLELIVDHLVPPAKDEAVGILAEGRVDADIADLLLPVHGVEGAEGVGMEVDLGMVVALAEELHAAGVVIVAVG